MARGPVSTTVVLDHRFNAFRSHNKVGLRRLGSAISRVAEAVIRSEAPSDSGATESSIHSTITHMDENLVTIETVFGGEEAPHAVFIATSPKSKHRCFVYRGIAKLVDRINDLAGASLGVGS